MFEQSGPIAGKTEEAPRPRLGAGQTNHLVSAFAAGQVKAKAVTGSQTIPGGVREVGSQLGVVAQIKDVNV